jgi:hypothetical protein
MPTEIDYEKLHADFSTETHQEWGYYTIMAVKEDGQSVDWAVNNRSRATAERDLKHWQAKYPRYTGWFINVERRWLIPRQALKDNKDE